MAEALKDSFGPDIPRRIAAMVAGVHPAFPTGEFLAHALEGYDDLALKARARRIAEALAASLPSDFREAVRILLASLGPELEGTGGHGMAPFLYMPHGMVVAMRGLDDAGTALDALHAITRRFTAEFAIRPFLHHHLDETFARLGDFAADPDPHVRRLVSEGTRPRLPWAERVPALIADPGRIIMLLDRLVDDPSDYVRRSVANNLNDIGKDHPDLAIATAARWLAADRRRRPLVSHGLRWLVKAGNRAAMAVLGAGDGDGLALEAVSLQPARVAIGGKVAITVTIANTGPAPTRALADLAVHFVKADGRARPKVFKLGVADLRPGERRTLRVTVSLAVHTTRRPYPGRHGVDVMLNGTAHPAGAFDVLA